MSIDTNVYLGPYLKYKPLDKTYTNLKLECSRKHKVNERDFDEPIVFCPTCGEKRKEIEVSYKGTKDVWDLCDDNDIDAHDLICRTYESPDKNGYDIVVANDENFHLDIDDSDIKDISTLNIKDDVNNFREEIKDILDLFDEESIEYSIGYGVIVYYS